MGVNIWMYIFSFFMFIILSIVVSCCTGWKNRARGARRIVIFWGTVETLFSLYGISNCWANEELQYAFDNRQKEGEVTCNTPETWSNCYPMYWTLSIVMIWLRIGFIACGCFYCICCAYSVCCCMCCAQMRGKK